MQKSIWMQNTLKLETDGLQQQKTPPGATPANWEQETKAKTEKTFPWFNDTQLLLRWWFNGVADMFLVQFGALITNLAWFCLPEYSCWLYPCLYGCSQLEQKHVTNWFLGNDSEFMVLIRPPQSPDLSELEHLRNVVEQEICTME